MRFAIGVSYDGSSFDGWQSQPSGRAVQDHLERALAQIAGADVRVAGAGRTDAGVHAVGQVAHFDTLAVRPDTAWVRGTNSNLPSGISVTWVQPVDERFHARFAARSRTYHYLLRVSAVRPALFAQQLGWFHLPLELRRMQEAAAMLVGSHDFTSFRAAGCQAKTPVRLMHEARVIQSGETFVMRFRADAFLHHMVRNIVGALVMIGKGGEPVSWMGELLQAKDRRLGAPTFAPDGLYLSEVEYDPDWALPPAPVPLPGFPWL